MREMGTDKIILREEVLIPSKTLNPILIMIEIMRLRKKGHHSMTFYIFMVHLDPNMLVCVCVYNILSYTMILFLW